MDLSFLRRAVAEACRVLAHEGLAADVLGHVSVRVDQDTLLVRCRGPHESGLLFTTPDDVHLVGLDGQHDLPAGYTVPGELPIHVETLRSRPDVIAVVHAHPPAVVAADLAGLALRPIIGAFNIPAMRMAHRGVPVYPRAVLIRRAELAAEMLAAMGTAPVCVLRGHGVTATGGTIAEAAIRGTQSGGAGPHHARCRPRRRPPSRPARSRHRGTARSRCHAQRGERVALPTGPAFPRRAWPLRAPGRG